MELVLENPPPRLGEFVGSIDAGESSERLGRDKRVLALTIQAFGASGGDITSFEYTLRLSSELGQDWLAGEEGIGIVRNGRDTPTIG